MTEPDFEKMAQEAMKNDYSGMAIGRAVGLAKAAYSQGLADGEAKGREYNLGLSQKEWLLSEQATLKELIQGGEKAGDFISVIGLKSRLEQVEDELANIPEQKPMNTPIREKAMSKYTVTIPIAGHAFIDVEADSEEQAIDKAFEVVERDDIEEWDAIATFNTGNVCHCPLPWEVKVEGNQ